jgi:hypothetical protein
LLNLAKDERAAFNLLRSFICVLLLCEYDFLLQLQNRIFGMFVQCTGEKQESIILRKR